MIDAEHIQEVKRAAQERLLVLPGVHAVGVGPKLVDGKPTGELAIKVYVVQKKPLAELTIEEIIPPEIDGVKTDVIEMDVPSLHVDDSKERPLILGTQVMAKNAQLAGTLGFLAHTDEPDPKLVATTCQHVVAAPMGGTVSTLTAITPAGTPNPYKVIFSGSNTPGSLVLVKMASPSQGRRINVFWSTTDTDTDTLSSIATSLVAAINGTPGAGVTAAIGNNPEEVVIIRSPGADTIVGDCVVYDPVIPDPKAKLLATVAGNVVTLSGKTDGEYAIYTSWSTNGSEPSHGGFTPAVKGSALTTVANDIASAINGLKINGIVATPNGTTVTIAGAARVLCQITSDIRVGPPADGFSSNCSLCCTDEIGRVQNSRTDLDVALIQLRRGLSYLDEVKGDKPKLNTPINGVHDVTPAEAQASYPVNKRGRSTLFTSGTVDALDSTGYATNSASDGSWNVFYRYYDHAMFVVGDGGLPFSDRGDSGSAVLNNSGEIVGMIFAGTSDRSVVTPIDQITTGAHLTVVTASALGQKQMVSDAEGALAMVRADGDLVSRQLLEAQA